MKLPLKVFQPEPWIILDADDETVCEIDSQNGTMADDEDTAAEIVSAVNQRAEMVALLREAERALPIGSTIRTRVFEFLAKEPTP
jgi:hypothetical protein